MSIRTIKFFALAYMYFFANFRSWSQVVFDARMILKSGWEGWYGGVNQQIVLK